MLHAPVENPSQSKREHPRRLAAGNGGASLSERACEVLMDSINPAQPWSEQVHNRSFQLRTTRTGRSNQPRALKVRSESSPRLCVTQTWLRGNEPPSAPRTAGSLPSAAPHPRHRSNHSHAPSQIRPLPPGRLDGTGNRVILFSYYGRRSKPMTMASVIARLSGVTPGQLVSSSYRRESHTARPRRAAHAQPDVLERRPVVNWNEASANHRTPARG